MWTYNRNGIAPQKKKKLDTTRKVTFPAIANGPQSISVCVRIICQYETLQQHSKLKRQSTSHRVQELFFSQCLADHGPLDRMTKIHKKGETSIPFTKVSEEAESKIEAHLRDHLQQRQKAQSSVSKKKAGDVLHLIKTKDNLLKDNTFKALLDVRKREGEKENSSRLLRSSVGLDEKQEGEREEQDAELRGHRRIGEVFTESDKCLSAGSTKNALIKSERDNRFFCGVEHSPHQLGHVSTNDFPDTNFPTSYPKKRRFMVYVCGGYKDTVAERSALMDHAYPKLYLHCKQRGYDFRMVDLRLGVQDPIADHHDTAELHVETLRQCQDTLAPQFMLFLGQKFEVQSLPNTIAMEAFMSMVSVLERDRQRLAKNKPVDDIISDSQSSIAMGSYTGSLVQESYLRSGNADFPDYEDQVKNSGLMSESLLSHHSLLDVEEARVNPVGARSWGDFDKELTLLRMWYVVDENCIPPVYRLLPISTHHPDLLSGDGQRRQLAKKAWRATSQRLWGVLHRSGTEALGEEGASLLLRTVLDREVEQGLRSHGSQVAPPEEHCHCYKRFIPDLQSNLRNEHAAHFIDLLKGRPLVNQTLYAAHQGLMKRIHQKLRHTNIYERNVGWGRNGLSPEHNQSHQFYTERICSHFQRTVINSLNKVMKVKKARGSFDIRRREDSIIRQQEEIQRHIRHCLVLEKGFVLRDSFLEELRRVIEGSSTRPVLLLGPPGWGKSTTLAKVARLSPFWIPGDVRVLVCFMGLTGDSRNVRLVLQSLCVQLAKTYCPHMEPSERIPELTNEFHSLLERAGAEQPVVLVLDGLDELSEEHGPDLSWFSVPLPPHVHLLLSATTDSACAHNLQRIAQPTVLSLPALSPGGIKAVLENKLQADHRQLQDTQWKLLLQACLSCPSPLYLEVAYAETQLWSSFTLEENLSLEPELEGLYLGILSRLEKRHGPQLVKRVAAIISLSRGGVTEEELLDLLARDGKVLQEVALSHPDSSSGPKVPYVLWGRLRGDLGLHLTEADADGTSVYRWTHSELDRVCGTRYLQTEDSRKLVHADYADYFRVSRESKHGNVFQPLAWTLTGEEEEAEQHLMKSCVFNLRKLHGLPYHLVQSGQILPFLSECVFNYEFLLHKAWGLSMLHIEEDLKQASLPDKELVDVAVLSGALELSRPVLEKDPCQMASQIIGRLGRLVAEDRPVAPGDPLRFTYLHALLDQCAHPILPVLVPSYTCLVPPGGLRHTLLAGHLCPVTALAGGQKGSLAVSAGEDGTLRLWDLELQRVVKTLEGVGGLTPNSLTLGLQDRILVVRMGQSLQVREVDSGRVVYSESDSMDFPVVTTTCDRQLLVAFYDGSHLVKVFDLASSCSLLCCVHINLEYTPLHKDSSILLSQNSIKDYVLFAYRSGSQAAVFSARGGSVLCVLSAQQGAASIQGVEMTSEYLLLFCRYPYKRDQIIHIELFSTATFQYQRSILGCSQDYISQVTVNRAGTHTVAFCPSHRTGMTEVVTWNLETEDHKHITHFPGILTAGVCFDLRFCLGFCSGEKSLRLWDLSSRIQDQTLTYNVHKPKKDGTEEIIPMGKSPRYAVCRSLRPGTVHVWNLARQRYTNRPVRVEHGLFGNTDVALAHDLKLYILTDRGTDMVMDTPSSIFQTLLVYDLVKKSYLRRQTGLYIVPCPQHEYRLLEGQILLGLSETRDHLILWELESGYIKGRIKPSHKESLFSGSMIRERQSQILPSKDSTTFVMPWDRRTETNSARRQRLEREAQKEEEEQQQLDREKYNAIDQYLLSGDEQVVVCSYFAHHLNVFSMASQDHLHTLEDRTSLLTLCPAALTHSGKYLVLANYSQAQRTPYLTLWDLHTGMVKKRLRNEPGVCCVAITGDASRVAFGVTCSNRLKVWDPFKRNHKTVSGYGDLIIGMSSQIYIIQEGTKAVLLSGQISLWDLETCNVLSVLSTDAHVQCLTLLEDGVHTNSTLLLGLSHSPALISVRLVSKTTIKTTREEDLFGESSSSEDENS